MIPTYQPSLEQEDIFSFVRAKPGRNLIISACAGGAKTTTLCLALNHIPRNPNSFIPPAVLFLAFNKAIADTLAKRVPSWVRTSTFHSLGLRALRDRFPKVKVEAQKVPKLVWRLCDRDDPDTALIIRAVGLLKSIWPTVERSSIASWLADVHSLDFAFELRSVERVWKVFNQSLEDTDTTDFDDMLLLPLVHDCPFPMQDWVLVDEAQDTNDVQLEILFRLAKPIQQAILLNSDWQKKSDTIFLFVGDPYQAIYAFRGANSDSMSRIAARFACSTLPLSVSYRCPQLHVKEAQKYV